MVRTVAIGVWTILPLHLNVSTYEPHLLLLSRIKNTLENVVVVLENYSWLVYIMNKKKKIKNKYAKDLF